MTLDDAPVLRREVLGRDVDGEAVLFDTETGSMFVLNDTATLLWRLLDGTVTLRELAADIADEFEVDRAAAERDVLALVEELDQNGLLQT